MVRVKAPLMSLTAQKQLGHSLIYKQKGSRSIVTAYNKPGGKNPAPASPSQKDKRMIYNLIIARWQTLTDEQKAVYNDLVKNQNLAMSGWNYFYQQSLKDLKTYLGLVGYWSFNEIVGGKILDLSGNGNDGILSPSYPNNCPQLVDSLGAKFGKAGSFDGVDDFVNCGNGENLNITDKITIEAWVKPATLSQDAVIVCQDVPSGAGKISIGIFNTGDLIFLGTPANQKGLSGISSYLTAGKWQHWVEIYDFTDDSIKFYLDGVEQTLTDVGNYWSTDGGTLRIGARGTGHYFNGTIDDVRIYNRALSPAEITKLFNLRNI